MTPSPQLKLFSEQTTPDAVRVINAYIAGWPYSRAVDAGLVGHWKTMGAMYQPENMLTVYRDGEPRAFVHGERHDKQYSVHLLAIVRGAVADAVWALQQVEEKARGEGIERLCGPFYRSGCFYGGYVCGLEPYHPHWAVEGTEVYVRAGFRISLTGTIMVADLSKAIILENAGEGYQIGETQAKPEYAAQSFRYAAFFEGKEVAGCAARLYPSLMSPRDGPVGQLGHVGTDEAHRGKGLARILAKLCLKRFKEWGASEALIATGLDNYPALKSYEKAGFERRYNMNEWSKEITNARACL